LIDKLVILRLALQRNNMTGVVNPYEGTRPDALVGKVTTMLDAMAQYPEYYVCTLKLAAERRSSQIDKTQKLVVGLGLLVGTALGAAFWLGISSLCYLVLAAMFSALTARVLYDLHRRATQAFDLSCELNRWTRALNAVRVPSPYPRRKAA